MTLARRLTGLAGLAALVVATGCSGPDPQAPTSMPAPTTTGGATSAPVSTASPGAAPTELVEPTTTNTLPPPPRPTGPAPSTAGALTAASLPLPAGWRTVEPPGNDELGQPGNGTWVQATDPRYAAQGAISIGCAEVTRDDYPDPTEALTGGYASRTKDPGVGLALQFSSAGDAEAYWSAYVASVRACVGQTGGIAVASVREPAVAGGQGLVDQRTDDTQDPQDWTEVGALHGARVVLLVLGDPGHRISDAAAETLLGRIPA